MSKEEMLAAGLITSLAVSIAIFGGTEPISFAAVEVLLLGLGLFLVVSEPRELPARIPTIVPGLLLGLVLFSLVPLPRAVRLALDDRIGSRASASFAPISVVPYQTRVELLHWVTYLAAFYLALVVCRRSSARKHLATALIALGAIEGMWGLSQFLAGWPSLASFFSIQHGGPMGTYINRDDFAGLLEMIFPFALALVFCRGEAALEPEGENGRKPLRSFLVRPGLGPFIFWLFLSAILFLAIVGSLSRMGIFSALLATGFVAFLAISTTHRRSVGGLLLLGFLCVAVALSLWVGIQPLIDRFAAPDLFTSRTGMWADTLALIRKSPLGGIGLGSLGVAITPVQTVYLNFRIDHAHNDYLEFIAELGLPGALLLFASVFWIFCRDIQALYRRGRDLPKALALGSAGSLIAIFSHSLTDFNLHIPANALVFAVVLGLAYSVSTAPAVTAPPGTD